MFLIIIHCRWTRSEGGGQNVWVSSFRFVCVQGFRVLFVVPTFSSQTLFAKHIWYYRLHKSYPSPVLHLAEVSSLMAVVLKIAVVGRTGVKVNQDNEL